jgi:hypothetical protein
MKGVAFSKCFAYMQTWRPEPHFADDDHFVLAVTGSLLGNVINAVACKCDCVPHASLHLRLQLLESPCCSFNLLNLALDPLVKVTALPRTVVLFCCCKPEHHEKLVRSVCQF